VVITRCGGKPVVSGREALEISLTIHQTGVPVSLERPRTGRGKGAASYGDPDQLCLAILARYYRDQVREYWQDGQRGRLERFVQEIAVEVVVRARSAVLTRQAHRAQFASPVSASRFRTSAIGTTVIGNHRLKD
jgi:hypothetical protein